jgi:hypothetical protein
MTDAVATDPPANGIYVEKKTGDTNLFGVVRNSSSDGTRADTTIAPGTSWVAFRMRRIDATHIGFTAATTMGAIMATPPSGEVSNASTQPAKEMKVGCQVITAAAAAKNIQLDYFDMAISALAR